MKVTLQTYHGMSLTYEDGKIERGVFASSPPNFGKLYFCDLENGVGLDDIVQKFLTFIEKVKKEETDEADSNDGWQV